MEQQDSKNSFALAGGSKDQVHSESDRYIHDILQANAMRRVNRKTPATNTVTKTKEDAIALGLRGLEEADSLRQQGFTQNALELYKYSIDVLIQTMKQLEGDSLCSLDLNVLREQIQMALSAAEELKKLIQKGESMSQQTTCEKTTESSPMEKTCFAKIVSYLNSLRENEQKPSHQQLVRPHVLKSATVTRKSGPPSPSNRTLTSHATRRTYPPAVRASSHATRSLLKQSSQSLQNKVPTTESATLMKSVMDEMYVPTSQLQSTTWNDVAGLADAKQALQEAAIMPLLRPDLFTGLRKAQNVLLYGPPGTGKTMLIKAVAHESKCNLFLCTASSITSKWLGEGEKLVRALFQAAQQHAPSIIFIDEIDALLSSRKSEGEHEATRRFKTEFMVCMDGIRSSKQSSGNSVLLMACTNCPWDLDSAILRRFPRRIYVPLPDKSARKALVRAILEKDRHNLTKQDISDLVKRLKGFSGSDIVSIASESSFGPLRDVGGLEKIRSVKARDVRPISIDDFDNAIDKATKSVTRQQLAKYDEWKKEQGA